MKQSNNICKFIVPRNEGTLTTKNFIYECAVTFSGELQLRETNVLHLVAGGQGQLTVAGHRYDLSAGTVFITLAGIPFVIQSIAELSYYYVSFTGGRGDELLSRFGITPAHCIFEHQHGLLPLWQDSLLRADEGNIDLLSESLLLHTFSRFKCPVRPDDLVTSIREYLEEHFSDHTLTLAALAQTAGYSANYLSHLFKQKFGMSFSEYLRLLRIKHAVLLIENGVTSVKNVAALCGYTDPLYFSKLFTQALGVPPSRYHKESPNKI